MTRERKTLPTPRTHGPREVVWVKSDWFCMECGKPDVWQLEDAGDDYYHSFEADCHSCGHQMCCVGKVTDAPEPKRAWWDERPSSAPEGVKP